MSLTGQPPRPLADTSVPALAEMRRFARPRQWDELVEGLSPVSGWLAVATLGGVLLGSGVLLDVAAQGGAPLVFAGVVILFFTAVASAVASWPSTLALMVGGLVDLTAGVLTWRSTFAYSLTPPRFVHTLVPGDTDAGFVLGMCLAGAALLVSGSLQGARHWREESPAS